MFALAYLAAVRKDAIGGVDLMNLAAELLPLTVPEVRRLLWALVSQRLPPPRTVLHWSHGDGNISNAPGAPIGADKHNARSVKPGCSTIARISTQSSRPGRKSKAICEKPKPAASPNSTPPCRMRWSKSHPATLRDGSA